MRIKPILIGVIALTTATLVLVLSVRPFLESKLIATLEAQGFRGVKLTVSYPGWRGIALTDIALGEDTPLLLRNASVDYSLSDLRHQRISGLTVDGLVLTGYPDHDTFRVHGLESLMESKQGGSASLPVTHTALSALPLTSLTVTNSRFVYASPALAMDIPMELTWKMEPVPSVHYEAPAWTINLSDLALSGKHVTVDALLDDSAAQWNGTWKMDGITMNGAPLALPELSATGTLVVQAAHLRMQGQAISADRTYRATFDLAYDLADRSHSALALSDVRMPWNGGMVGLNKARFPLAEKQATTFTLAVEHVSMEALMKSFAGTQVTGTGTVSGTLPVTIAADGTLRFHEGTLHADASGVIAIAPEIIPGDNAQVTVVRDVLKNLHYTTLSVAMQSANDKKLSVVMTVEGKNPDLPNARPVRLKVQFSGDVLNLIKQNVMAISAPQHLLEQKQP